MSLTEFLLARIAEDETRLLHGGSSGDGFRRWIIPQVLAECEAKRQIVEWAASSKIEDDWDRGSVATLEVILRNFAAVYADHPDYREDMEL